jgi:hypothetical protein
MLIPGSVLELQLDFGHHEIRENRDWAESSRKEGWGMGVVDSYHGSDPRRLCDDFVCFF